MSRHGKKSPPKQFVKLAFVLLFWSAGLGVFFFESQEYAAYTGRAQAEVTRVETRADHTVYYVDYRAEGRQHTDVGLGGNVGTGISDYGQELTVAYDPAEPEDPVTEVSTEERRVLLFGAASAACLAGAVGCIVIAVARKVRG